VFWLPRHVINALSLLLIDLCYKRLDCCCQMILFATSVVSAWLPQSDVSNRYHEATPVCNVCCLGMAAPIRCELQASWGYWRMILLATSISLTWLSQSDLSNKDQRTVTLLQWMNSYQNLTTFLCKGFIVVSEDCELLLIIWQVLLYLNIAETEHCKFFWEYMVIFETFFLHYLYSIINSAYSLT
jgi:hypothetical protein